MANVSRWRQAVIELCDVGRWQRCADGSYAIHDYLIYQPSRSAVLKEREDARVRKRTERGRFPARSPAGQTPEFDRSSDRPVPGPGINSSSRKQQQQPEHARAKQDTDPRLLAEHQRRLEQERQTAAATAKINSSDKTT
jgi:hypothetical protein